MGFTDAIPVTVKGVCADAERRVLLCRNDRSEWELPGGRPEPGESFATCLIREIREETGLAATVRDLIASYHYEVLPGRWVKVIAYGREVADPQSPVRSLEHHRVAFIDPDSLQENEVAAGYRTAIEAWLS